MSGDGTLECGHPALPSCRHRDGERWWCACCVRYCTLYRWSESEEPEMSEDERTVMVIPKVLGRLIDVVGPVTVTADASLAGRYTVVLTGEQAALLRDSRPSLQSLVDGLLTP